MMSLPYHVIDAIHQELLERDDRRRHRAHERRRRRTLERVPRWRRIARRRLPRELLHSPRIGGS